MTTTLLLVGLFLAVVAMALLATWTRLPYAILLVLGGLGLGFLPGLPTITLDPDLVLLLFLPPLVFSSAVAALRAGHYSIGLGVVLGSNLFNLAFLLGLGAVLAGAVYVPRASLVLDGGVGVMVTLLTGALVLNLTPPLLCAALLLAFLAPYVVALSMSPRRLAALPLPDRWSSLLAMAVKEIDHGAAEDPRVQQAGGPGRPGAPE